MWSFDWFYKTIIISVVALRLIESIEAIGLEL